MIRKKDTMRYFSRIFFGLLLLSFTLSACSFPGFPIVPQPTPNTRPVRGGIWIDELYTDPDSLIPNGAAKRVAAIIDQAIYAPLFYGDASGAIHPGLAQAMPTLANG